MGARQGKLLVDEALIETLTKETGFNESQLQRLYHRFNQLDLGNKGYLAAKDLLRLPELETNPLAERLILAIYKERFDSDDTAGNVIVPPVYEVKIPFSSFAKSFARFRWTHEKPEKNNKYSKKEAKMHFIFRMFDVNEEGKIGIREIFALLKTLSPNVEDEELVRFSEEILVEATTGDSATVRIVVWNSAAVLSL